eukprot:scaffold131_cov632-Prasinococcus_capsulatus_cf.AAC.2
MAGAVYSLPPGLPRAPVGEGRVTRQGPRLLPRQQARRRRVLPIKRAGQWAVRPRLTHPPPSPL